LRALQTRISRLWSSWRIVAARFDIMDIGAKKKIKLVAVML